MKAIYRSETSSIESTAGYCSPEYCHHPWKPQIQSNLFTVFWKRINSRKLLHSGRFGTSEHKMRNICISARGFRTHVKLNRKSSDFVFSSPTSRPSSSVTFIGLLRIILVLVSFSSCLSTYIYFLISFFSLSSWFPFLLFSSFFLLL
jgi:hypothetical protein